MCDPEGGDALSAETPQGSVVCGLQANVWQVGGSRWPVGGVGFQLPLPRDPCTQRRAGQEASMWWDVHIWYGPGSVVGGLCELLNVTFVQRAASVDWCSTYYSAVWL